MAASGAISYLLDDRTDLAAHATHGTSRYAAMSDSTTPPYTVRVSARAKRLHLKVLRTGSVEVVAPKGFDLQHIPHFVAQHHEWVRQTLAKFAANDINQLPACVHLPAVAEQWLVNYTHPIGPCLKDTHGHRPITIDAPTSTQARQQLHAWLNQQAKTHLVPWLEQLSRRLGLHFERATIRAQKTRWGSCSARRTISLNRNLLFLAPELVRYVLIHELCHIVHMNHSQRYWQLVGDIEPNYRNLDARLRHGYRDVPGWALPD